MSVCLSTGRQAVCIWKMYTTGDEATLLFTPHAPVPIEKRDRERKEGTTTFQYALSTVIVKASSSSSYECNNKHIGW